MSDLYWFSDDGSESRPRFDTGFIVCSESRSDFLWELKLVSEPFFFLYPFATLLSNGSMPAMGISYILTILVTGSRFLFIMRESSRLSNQQEFILVKLL